MSSTAYYLLWLVAGLLAIAMASGLFVWRLRLRQARELKAIELLDALARYTEWVAAQGRAVRFQAPVQDGDPALLTIGAVQEQWFPEFGELAQALFAVHLKLAQLLRSHRQLRLQDPEACLESGQDASFMALWREHCRAVQALEQQLAAAAQSSPAPARLTFPA